MTWHNAEYAPEHRIVKGMIVKQPSGYYRMKDGWFEMPIDLPSGRVVAVTYKKCRELPAKDSSIIYDPYDISDVLIDFGWLGKIICHPANIVISDGQMVCLTHARPMP